MQSEGEGSVQNEYWVYGLGDWVRVGVFNWEREQRGGSSIGQIDEEQSAGYVDFNMLVGYLGGVVQGVI